MPKIIRYILLALGLVIILPIIAVGIFVAVFDANAYKQELSSLVQNNFLLYQTCYRSAPVMFL